MKKKAKQKGFSRHGHVLLGLSAVALGLGLLAALVWVAAPKPQLALAYRSVPTESGVEGRTWLKVVPPFCRIRGTVFCARFSPYQATVSIKRTENSPEVTRVTSNTEGLFTVALPPGNYVLIPLADSQNGYRAEPQSIQVRPHTYTRISIAYDGGVGFWPF